MAKNVVLKDADGNELNAGKLYKHNLYIAIDTDEMQYFNYVIYSTNSKEITTFEEFISYFLDDVSESIVFSDENEMGKYFGSITKQGGENELALYGFYVDKNSSANHYFTFTSVNYIDDTVIPL